MFVLGELYMLAIVENAGGLRGKAPSVFSVYFSAFSAVLAKGGDASWKLK